MADIDVVPKGRSTRGWMVWVMGAVLVALAIWALLSMMSNAG